jgi:phycobilisome core-membrane linker protein
VRNTEASTQRVIRAVYVQVLGNTGYAGEHNKVEEIKLENADISLREFVRQVARSDAFRRRYWSGLYICKAIEVMHRRLLGRPTFGRWEIDAYFDVAARKGFYGVVDAMLNSREYSDSFGEDTVPYERFITPTDLSTRRVPALKRAFNAAAYADLTPRQRPDVAAGNAFRDAGSLTPRNLPAKASVVRGGWSATLTGGETLAPQDALQQGPGSVQAPPAPERSWSAPRWQPGGGLVAPWSSGTTITAPAAFRSAPSIGGGWSASLSTGAGAFAEQPGAAMAKALRPGTLQGFSKRQSLGGVLKLAMAASPAERTQAIEAVYRQLLGRQPLASERLVDAESQLRNGELMVADFVAKVAGSELFNRRLNRMAPLRAASAAYLALLGRAAQPDETSRFLATRSNGGQRAALEAILNGQEYAESFGRDTVPHLKGMATSAGIPLTTVNRTAALYGGNAALIPPNRGAI